MNWFTTNDLLKREGPYTYSADYIVWYVVVAIAVCAGLYFLNRYKTEKRVKTVFIVLWAMAVTLDAVKQVVNIYDGFSIGGDLPLYVCSLFLYIMPVAIWGKGIFKDLACAYICTINIFGAIGNYVVPSIVTRYSIFSFYGFHTTLYHTILWTTTLVMLCTGYYKVQFKKFGWQMLGFVIVTFPVIIFNYIADTNYMYFNTGIFIEDFAAKVGYAWPLFMYAGYAAIMIVMELLIVGVTKLVEIIAPAIKKGFNKSQAVDNNFDTAAEQNEEQVNPKNKNE